MRRTDFDAVGLEPAAFSAEFLPDFDRLFARLLGHRAHTMRAALAATLVNGRSPLVVETGCLRIAGNWAGDGQSTFLFDCLANATGGLVFSVDVNPEAARIARSVTSELTQIACDDSVAYLARFKRPIDLLYLDSFDLDANRPLSAAHHHIFELAAAMPNLKPGSVVIVDDTWRHQGEPFGKGMLVADYMRHVGGQQIAEGYQFAWMM